MSFITKSITQNRSTSITEGPIWKGLLMFFFPILFGTFFQQLYNTIDAVIVGRCVGKEALAAVGGGTSVFVNLLVGFFIGLTSGASVLISQFYGAKNGPGISRSVHTSVMLCIFGGIIIMILGISLSRPMMILTKTPEEVLDSSVLYLKVFFSGAIPMLIYNMGSSILRGTGDSRTPLIILMAGCLSNIILDLIFVVIFRLGVFGVALATVLCQAESAVIVIIILAKSREEHRLDVRKLTVTPHILREIIRIGFPAGIQSCLYTVSNLIIQANINAFGTDYIASWAAYGKIDAVFWMMINAFGIATTTFAGQNFGAGHTDRIKKSMWEALLMSATGTVIVSALFLVFGKPALRLFTGDSSVIEKGMEMMNFLVPFWITYISIEILSGTIRGTGTALVPTLITIFGICGLRIAWLFTAVPLRPQITTVIFSYPLTWIVTSIIFWIYYASGKWLRKS